MKPTKPRSGKGVNAPQSYLSIILVLCTATLALSATDWPSCPTHNPDHLGNHCYPLHTAIPPNTPHHQICPSHNQIRLILIHIIKHRQSAAVVERTNSLNFWISSWRRSRVCIPGSHHSFIESRFYQVNGSKRRGILQKRPFRARRCGDEGFDINFSEKNGMHY